MSKLNANYREILEDLVYKTRTDIRRTASEEIDVTLTALKSCMAEEIRGMQKNIENTIHCLNQKQARGNTVSIPLLIL